ncbi:hypothetical protein KGM_206770A, partial [Danaus plexippus plexippus]
MADLICSCFYYQ